MYASNGSPAPSHLPPKDPLVNNAKYVKVCDLNAGAFGSVVLALERATQKPTAIKFIPRGPQKITKYVEGEVLLLRRFNHPHIVQFAEVFVTEEHLAICMEFMEGGNLYEYILNRKQRLPEDEARWFFQQLVCAVDYCHNLGVACRDLKLENTLLNNTYEQALRTTQRYPLIKLCDFGYSKDEHQQSMPKSRVGTMDYIAPEIVLNMRGAQYDGKKADIWALAIILYAMVTLKYPFRRPEDDNVPQEMQGPAVLKRIVRGEYEMPNFLSPELQDLLQRCLQRDPALRPSIADIQQHPWFQRNMPPGAMNMNDTLINDPRYNKGSPACTQTLDEVRAVIREAQREGGIVSPSASMQEAEMYLCDMQEAQSMLQQLHQQQARPEDHMMQQIAYAAGPGAPGENFVSSFSLADPLLFGSIDLNMLPGGFSDIGIPQPGGPGPSDAMQPPPIPQHALHNMQGGYQQLAAHQQVAHGGAPGPEEPFQNVHGTLQGPPQNQPPQDLGMAAPPPFPIATQRPRQHYPQPPF